MSGNNLGDQQVVWRPECSLLWTRDAASISLSRKCILSLFLGKLRKIGFSPLMDKQQVACQALGEHPKRKNMEAALEATGLVLSHRA